MQADNAQITQELETSKKDEEELETFIETRQKELEDWKKMRHKPWKLWKRSVWTHPHPSRKKAS